MRDGRIQHGSFIKFRQKKKDSSPCLYYMIKINNKPAVHLHGTTFTMVDVRQLGSNCSVSLVGSSNAVAKGECTLYIT